LQDQGAWHDNSCPSPLSN